jgi:FkbM family methyltransferase
MIGAIRPPVRTLLHQLTSDQTARHALRGLSRRGLLPQAVWRRLPVELVFEVEVNGVAFSYCSDRGDDIGRFLYWTGLRCYERETVEVFLALVEHSRTFVDVGANTGLFTLLACAARAEVAVVAFEPVPRVFERLCLNVALSGFAGRCSLRPEAVADLAGAAPLHVPRSDLPKSASLDQHGFRGLAGDLIEVRTTTIDDLRQRCGPIDLMKLDVEGHEHLALVGMRETLASDRPLIILECHADGPVAAVQAELDRSCYVAYHCRPEGPKPSSQLNPDPRLRYPNWLCVPRERSAAIDAVLAETRLRLPARV